MALSPGNQARAYEWLGSLGAGGMGESTARATPGSTARSRSRSCPGFRQRIRSAASGSSARPRGLAAESSAHCTIHDIGEQDGQPTWSWSCSTAHLRVLMQDGKLRMARCSGSAPRSPMRSSPPCRGHRHRDITPANIFVTGHGEARSRLRLAKLQTRSARQRLRRSPDEGRSDSRASHGARTLAVHVARQALGRGRHRERRVLLGVVLYEMACAAPVRGRTAAR